MADPDPDILEQTLRSEEWKTKSNVAIAKHLGISLETVRTHRNRLGLKPAAVEATNGDIVDTSRLGQKEGAALTQQQQDRIAAMLPFAERISRKKRNKILDEDELLSVAYDALIVAARHWRPTRQTGPEKAPGSKWRAYAVNGIMLAFSRAFKRARKRLRRTALFGDHPYQKWIISQRLKAGLQIGDDAESTKIADSIPDRLPPDTLMYRFQALTGPHKTIIECIAGLDGRDPWSIAELAAFWKCSMTEAEQMVEQAKQAMTG